MTSINDIKKGLEKEMNEFNKEFEDALFSENDTLKVVNDHVKSIKGKQLRPIMTILAAKICNNFNNNTLKIATAIELLHTASLLHDDVVDKSELRRGKKSVNSLWDNRIAVLCGDHMLATSLSTACKTGNLRLIETISKLGGILSQGELQQMENIQNIVNTEEKYLSVINQKTAKLFTACTLCGAISANATARQTKLLDDFGSNFGMLFQIRDDIFDYISTEKEIGKPVGNDIREGKMTLPLIHAYGEATQQEKDCVKDIYTRQDFCNSNVEKVIGIAKKYLGIEYAQKKMAFFKQKAEESLREFDNNEAKKMFLNLLDYSIQRIN